MKNELKGTVKFIFQPAEEGPPEGEEGGAPLMIKDGALENPKVDVMFGLHIESEIEVGKIHYRSGGIMAASDWFTIKIKGKQTHGSQPWAGIDPVTVAAQIINGLQTIVSRQVDITKSPAVVSVSTINGGVRANIIPEEITMVGTIRTLDTGVQNFIHDKIILKASKIAEASGATAETTIDRKTLVTYNNPALTKQMLPSFVKAAGEDNVAEVPACNWWRRLFLICRKSSITFLFYWRKTKRNRSIKSFPTSYSGFLDRRKRNENWDQGFLQYCF
jgi:amidohydrolase